MDQRLVSKDETPTEEEEPLSPASRQFRSPASDIYIMAKIGSKVRIDPSIVKAGLQDTIMKHPRFSSKMVGDVSNGGKGKWVRTGINIDDHFIVPDLDPNMDSPDRFIEDYISHMTQTPMDMSKPLWEFHVLNVKTQDAEALGVFRIHHSLGDGVSLMSLVLACTRRISDPQALPSFPVKKQTDAKRKLGFWRIFVTIWSFFKLMWYTAVDVAIFLATLMYLRDAEIPMKGARGIENVTRTFVHKILSLDDVMFVKNFLNVTINDVLLGVTQAGLSRYLNRRYGEAKNGENAYKCNNVNLPKSLRVRGIAYFNLRPTPGPQVAFKMFPRIINNTTVVFSNMVGPMEEVSFYGHPITYFAPSAYGCDNTLVLHFQSYVNKMAISISVDPDVIPDPHQLCDDFKESLQDIKDAAAERNSRSFNKKRD